MKGVEVGGRGWVGLGWVKWCGTGGMRLGLG